MRNIYILTTYTGTVLSYLIKNITKVDYAHVSIGMDADLKEVYSFGRKHVSNPFFAGFVREYIDNGLYKKKVNTRCRIYSVEVTDDEYDKIRKEVNYFWENRKKFKYDAFALVSLLNQNTPENKNKFVCSQFVAFVLEKGGVNLFKKPFNLVTPKDFLELKNINIVYEGYLRDFRIANTNKKVISN